MGVVVSETINEIVIATERVTANPRKIRPVIPPINKIGTKTAISEKTHSQNDFPGALECRLHPRHPSIDVPRYVFQYDNRIVNDQPG